MEVDLIENKTGLIKKALIELATLKEIPPKKGGWKFTWRKLIKTEGSSVYRISLLETPSRVEGLVMLTLMFDEMIYMNDIEVAPHNYGRNGEYENVAGCLIAFACKESFEKGKNDYRGFLSFDSKTQLIEFYARKYGATVARGSKMYIGPKEGKELIRKYLKII